MSLRAHIAVLNYRGALASAAHGAEEMLGFAASLRPNSDNSVVVLDVFKPGFDAYVLPPAVDHVDVGVYPELPKLLARAHSEGALMCSVCAGLTWLVEADVIGGRPVTTHLDLEGHMREHYPEVVLEVSQILIEHADLITAGGMMAWTDMCLALIERFWGRDALVETSRRFVVDLGRRDQRLYRRFRPNLSHQDSAIRKAQLVVEQRSASQLSIAELAEIAGLSPRTFVRRFMATTGLPPLAYVRSIRIEKAKDMLIHSNKPIQRLAFDVGYTDHSAFGRKFAAETGMSPREFRNRFSR